MIEPHVVILGGGGTRGFLHAGFCRALQESGLPVASYTGISVGSWGASFLAMGVPLDEIEKVATGFDLGRIVNVRSFGSVLWKHGSRYRGFFDPATVEREIERVVGRATFADTRIPIHVQSTDLATGEPFIFSRENTPDAPLALAVAASCALVGIFHPVTYQGRMLVDGTYCGYMLPESRPTLISNVSPISSLETLSSNSILNLMLRSYSLLPQVLIDDYKRKNPDVTEVIHDCRDVGILSFNVPAARKWELMRRSYGGSRDELAAHVRGVLARISRAA
jgi:predicted acylesterase/phospholipase RssA